MNNLKQWVNNKEFMDAWQEYVDTLIQQHHRTMEQADDPKVWYRSQGSIHTLSKLKLLREQINGG